MTVISARSLPYNGNVGYGLSKKGPGELRTAGKEPTIAFSLHIEAFANGQTIPVRYTCDGTNRSPALSWDGEPEAAESFVLIVDDPDAPVGTWNHWLLYDIPAPAHGLDEAFDPGQLGLSGTNDFGQPGYGGPCPPPGNGPHRYFFKLFALNVATLGLPQGVRRHVLDTALRGHVIAEAAHIGIYERKR